MRFKKVLAVAVMLAALIAIFAGVSLSDNYISQETRRNLLSTESVVVPSNGYGYYLLQANSSQENYFSITVSNGTLREAIVSEELYQAWQNGSYNLSWIEVPQPGWGQSQNYWPISSASQERWHYIFWNPDSPISKEVTINICEQWTETVYNNFNLGLGIFLIVAGPVSGACGGVLGE
jgi:hypothetical protein